MAGWSAGIRKRFGWMTDVGDHGVGTSEQHAEGGVEIMVETNDGARFELLVDVRQGQWRLLQAWRPQRMA